MGNALRAWLASSPHSVNYFMSQSTALLSSFCIAGRLGRRQAAGVQDNPLTHTSPRQDFLAMHRWLCRQRTKVARKCKCQRKLLIVSAVAFALPFLAARPRTKSQRRKKNIKPYGGEKKKCGDDGWWSRGWRSHPFPHIVACGYLATSFGQPSSKPAHVVPAFLTFAVLGVARCPGPGPRPLSTGLS